MMALLAGATQAQAARQAGVSERTVRRRLADPEFSDRYNAAFTDMFDRNAASLVASFPIARSTLIEVMTDPRAPATARVAASKAVIHYGLEYTHESTTAERLAQVEAAVARRGTS